MAAGARRDEYGKKERIYANEKSLDRFHDKIEDAFGRDVDLSAPVWAHGVEGATTQLAALTKAGKLPAETDAGISCRKRPIATSRGRRATRTARSQKISTRRSRSPRPGAPPCDRAARGISRM